MLALGCLDPGQGMLELTLKPFQLGVLLAHHTDGDARELLLGDRRSRVVQVHGAAAVRARQVDPRAAMADAKSRAVDPRRAVGASALGTLRAHCGLREQHILVTHNAAHDWFVGS